MTITTAQESPVTGASFGGFSVSSVVPGQLLLKDIVMPGVAVIPKGMR
ncbi:MAG: hypothetical protein H2045_05920 [Rhizobiales bacterium]|nr:hypothetical protein [Hyphomicrobiales bacterium]